MKIRTGFVSNSSSSSFCVYGIFCDIEEFRDKTNFKIKNDDEDDAEKLNIALEKLFVKTDITWNVGWEGRQVLIGLPYEKLKDNETGKEFKERAIKEITKKIPQLTKEDCEFHLLELEQ